MAIYGWALIKGSPDFDSNVLLSIYYVKRELKYIDFMLESDIHVIGLWSEDRLICLRQRY